ncbi:MAG: ComEC/Rec2 family competence protein, partial [Luminiphilus sp.]
ELNAAVLVLPHHGSNTSTSRSFLKWVKPSAGIISSGLANRFGHPHPAVLGRLRERGVEVFNTALSGTVRVFPEGESAEIIALRSGNIPYWLGLP